MKEKTCQECKKIFVPSSAHLKCPMCRYPSMKRVCACGEQMAPRSETCSKCTPQAGADNHNWRGGKAVLKNGYVMIASKASGHPRSKSNNGYVFEHILVMEDSIGRYLLPGETVHHKNGVKDDNRIENLELWTSNHPSGQRVSDLIAWAKQILTTYANAQQPD